MSRLTEKLKSGNYICGIVKGGFVDKLGKLEDLLQSYNVKDLEELDKLLEMATAYEELSKQLGCPLEVYVKLHQQMKFYRLNALNEIIECEIDNPNDDEVYHIQADGIIFNQYDYGWQFYSFKDYKKTWWLKRDKSE